MTQIERGTIGRNTTYSREKEKGPTHSLLVLFALK